MTSTARVAGAYAPAFVERICTRFLFVVEAGVAGAYAPAFVERRGASSSQCRSRPGVAGAYAPAFVERTGRQPTRWSPAAAVSPELMLRPSLSDPFRGAGQCPQPGVSPELMLRPSLSVRRDASHLARQARVAGAYAPAFVERPGRRATSTACRAVSPELMLRPSLSVRAARGVPVARPVSPELMLRPSLSDTVSEVTTSSGSSGVAGAYAPAFVERSLPGCASTHRSRSVAGAYAPAFVERGRRPAPCARSPSVAGAYAPAFVERSR